MSAREQVRQAWWAGVIFVAVLILVMDACVFWLGYQAGLPR